MRPVSVQAFADQAGVAQALATRLGVPFEIIDLHRFPDGELLPRVSPARTVIIYCSLDRPTEKLLALMLSADAWRRSGAGRLVLVSPYLCYMRQDAVFAPGEPLSRDVVGALLGQRFDRIVAVDPHLHRTHGLGEVFGTAETTTLSATGVLAAAVGADRVDLVVGPDAESVNWARPLAERLGTKLLAFDKIRRGDDVVMLRPSADMGSVAGQRVLLADDVCSSGATLLTAARLLINAGAASVEVAVTHALLAMDAVDRLRAAGVRRFISSDSVLHPTAVAPLVPLLAEALADELAEPKEAPPMR